jgi:hypothetical protein
MSTRRLIPIDFSLCNFASLCTVITLPVYCNPGHGFFCSFKDVIGMDGVIQVSQSRAKGFTITVGWGG